ncbi:MAG: hypothetical protein SOY27_04790 [Fournierella sp.]|uniref:hypothetical protein n=1 Tax=Allofournierella sp. TaxID=1940256 RepID=UPI002A83CCFD|nr:hypothetical protein [Fournierella sp.]MDY4166791.1 hypothetical protein [Fournierella sp.]
MLCCALALAAGLLGFFSRRRAGLVLAAMPLAALAVLAGLVQGLDYGNLTLILAAAAVPTLWGRSRL